MQNPGPPKPLSLSSPQDGTFLYTGPSMRPTFRPGDSFVVEKIPLPQLQLGDVVIFEQFHPDAETVTVIHRVILRRHGQYFTRGDNNNHLDPLPLDENTYKGRVEALQRRQRTRRVWKGRAGWAYAQLLYGTKRAWLFFQSIFSPLYRLIRTFNRRTRLWYPALSLLTIRTPQGIIVKYLFHGRTVAHYHLHTGAFFCRKPFDLVIEKPARTGTSISKNRPLS